MLARPLFATVLLAGAVVLQDARAADTVVLFVVGRGGTVSVITVPVVLTAPEGDHSTGTVSARVVDARAAPLGWTLSVSSAGCSSLWPVSGTSAAQAVSIYSSEVAVLVPSTTRLSVPHRSPATALVLRGWPQVCVTAATVNASIADVRTVVSVTTAKGAGAYVCPLTQTVS